MFLLLALLLLIFLPSPWDLIAVLVCGALGVGEVVYWQRRMRRRKVVTGVENLVGATGEVTETCAPVAVRDLTLDVQPTNGASGSNVIRVGFLAVVLVVVLALAGCGGDDDDNQAESWANSVCSSLSTWITDIDEAVTSLTEGGLSTAEEDVRSAVDQVADATNKLADDLEELEPPETESGEEAKSELESLATTLRSEVETARQAVESDGGTLSVTSTVSVSVSTAASSVQSTFNSLEGLDPGGELENGFENADKCDSFRDQMEDLGS
jgi:hypothetical protein